jgi:photosystem II stability/assembly factor-like uncharacterized protein
LTTTRRKRWSPRAAPRRDGGTRARQDNTVTRDATLLSLLGVCLVAVPAWGQIVRTDQNSGTRELLIAVSPVNDRVVWVSGTGGTWLRTTDGGTTWQVGHVPGADSLQFRDVYAASADEAWLLSIGDHSQSRIFHTADAGAHWTRQFTAEDPKDFFDCFSFWDARRAIAIGDAVDGRVSMLRTQDGGAHWTRVPAESLPPAGEGEGSFAASGLCVTTQPGGLGWAVTSRPGTARVLRTMDYGLTWTVDTLPTVARADAGPTSVSFRDAQHGMVFAEYVGAGAEPGPGDVLVAVTTDSGLHWTPTGKPNFRPGISGGVYVPGASLPTAVAVGYAGAAYSTDNGATWITIDGDDYWSVGFASPRAGWAVGVKGRITKLSGF